MSRPRLDSSSSCATVALACAAMSVVVARILRHVCLADVPHVMDEVAYSLQAGTFALGKLHTQLALPRAAFNTWFVDDRWARFSIFPPGWPAVLAVAMKLYLVNWINPILHGCSSYLVGRSARRLVGPMGGVAATAVYAFSPQALLLASSLMSHTLVALCASVVLVAAVECGVDANRHSWLVAAGAAIGLAAATRPLCACALFAALAAAALYAKVPIRRIAPALLPIGAFVLALAAYNAALTGSPFRFPQTSYFDEHLPPADVDAFNYHPGCNDLGFGPTHGCERTIHGGFHTVANALTNSGDNLSAWTALAGGGPLLLAALAYALREAETRRRRLVLLVAPASAIVLYALYWYAGTCYGARFYHAGLPSLLLVAGLGMVAIRARVLRATVVALWFGWNAYATIQSSRELRGYWGTDDRFAQLAARWDKPPALVMVAFRDEPLQMTPLRWTSPLIREGTWIKSIRVLGALGANKPMLDGPVVYSKFHPALVDALRARFSDRALWIYVAGADRSRDELRPYEPEHVEPREPYPPDNFDGYAVPPNGRR